MTILMGLGSLPEQRVGRIARVRQRHCVVADVSLRIAATSTIASFCCVDPDNLGQSPEVIWEQELEAEIPSEES